MKKEHTLSYLQEGAQKMFTWKFVYQKAFSSLVRSALIAWTGLLAASILMWIVSGSFWSAIINFALVSFVLFLYCISLWFRKLQYCQELFDSKIKDSPLWQQYFISHTVRFYKDVKKNYEEYFRDYEEIAVPENVGFFEELTIVPAVRAMNTRDECYKAMSEATLVQAKKDYEQLVRYCSEHNMTLP